MSALNQLFNRGLLGAKCKTQLNLAISHIKLLQNKRDVQLKQMRKEIAQFLQTGQESIARIRVEHVIPEQNIWAAYEILELFCEFVLARVPILESQRECPSELREAIASIIYAASRCSDLPELLLIKNSLTAKYGKNFVSAVSELRPDTSVNRAIIEKLSVSAPSAEVKLQILKDIAQEYNLDWDASRTEEEFTKKHEDMLDGPNQMRNRLTTDTQLPTKQASRHPSPAGGASPITQTNRTEGMHRTQASGPTSKMSLMGPDRIEQMDSSHSKRLASGTKTEAESNSADILERARAALASADRASAAARAAAELVNVKFGSSNLGGK